MHIENLGQALGIEVPIIVPIILLVYMAAMLAIGFYAAIRIKNSEDWFVGSRSMGPWITALAHGSSSIGGGMYVAGPQFGWEMGAGALWAAPGDVFGPLLNFGIIARRMRRFSERIKAFTIPDFFAARYYSSKVRVIAVVILLVSMLISMVVEYLALGVIISAITGWPFVISLVLGCVIILLYTGAGGYLAVAYTDFVQSVLMVIGLLILIPVCLINVGGFSGMNIGLYQINPGLPTLWGPDFQLWGAPMIIAGIALVYFIGYMGQPHLIIKTVAVKDTKSIRLVPLIGAVFGFLLAFGVYTLGCIGRVTFPELSMLPAQNAEYVMPMLTLKFLHPIMAGLLLAGATAAIMSTASALLLVIGSCAGNDLYKNILCKNATDESVMKVSKYSTYGLGLLGIAICFLPIMQIGIYQVTWIAWSVLSPAFVPPIIAGLYWRRATKEGAIASMLTGSFIGFLWYYTLQEATNIHTFFAALVCSTLAMVFVSLITPKPPKEIVDLVDYAAEFDPLDLAKPNDSSLKIHRAQLNELLNKA